MPSHVGTPISGVQGYYFFLSYPHAPPSPDGTDPNPDHWVQMVFADMCRAVESLSQPRAGWVAGFLDHLTASGADRAESIASALRTAEVFVPLYCPEYLNSPDSLNERASFSARLDTSATDSARHILPVLWSPPRLDASAEELRAARDLAADVPEYAERGLLVLSRLSTYRNVYDTLLDRLSQRIVDVVETSPLGPARTAVRIEPVQPARPQMPLFIVAVLAPSETNLPHRRHADSYGARPSLWKPFGHAQSLPAAEHAAQAAARLNLPTRIVDVDPDLDVKLFDHSPGLILIDPWIVATSTGRTDLESTVQKLPPWVMPMLVVNIADPQHGDRGARFAEAVTDMLFTAGAHRPKKVDHLEGFVQALPLAVVETQRQYLKSPNVRPPRGPFPERPRLAGGDADRQ